MALYFWLYGLGLQGLHFFWAPFETVQEIKASWTRAHKCKVLTHLAFDNPPHTFNPQPGAGGGKLKRKWIGGIGK